MNDESSIAKKTFCLITFCCFLLLHGFSQKVSTLISKEKIVLGEQVFVKIKVEGISQGQVQEDFHFPDTVNHLEILADSIDYLNSSSFEHTITITSFDSGTWQLPAFTLLLTDKKVLSSNPVTISVLPVDVSNLEDYHDIKDIMEINPENNWWILASIVLIGIISLFAVLWFMNSGTSIVTPAKKVTGSTLQQLYDQVMNQLNELENMVSTPKASTVRIFSESSDALRLFIDKTKGENTSYLTTGEYMAKQKNRLPNAALENSFFQYLRLADAVKFARYQPQAEETKASFPMLKSLASSVYQQSNLNN